MFLLGFLFWIASCQKPEIDTAQSTSPLQTLQRSPVTSIHQNALVTDKFDAMGRLWYRHNTVNVGGNPEVYLAPRFRSVLPLVSANYLAIKDKPFSEQVQPLLDEEVLSTQAVGYIQQFRAVINAMPDDITPEAAWTGIRQFEDSLIEGGLPEDDITPALYVSSILRNQLTYANETGLLTEERGDGCFLGRKLKCWEKVLEAALFASLKSYIEKTFFTGSGGNVDDDDDGNSVDDDVSADDDKTNRKLAIKGLLISAGIAAVIEIIKIYTDSDCKCDSSAPIVLDPCAGPKVMGLAIGDCGEVQTVEVSGQGTSAQGYLWSVQNGIAVDFPGVLTGILTTIPELRVKQNDPNIPMKINCFVQYGTCFGTKTISRDINIIDEVNSPGEVLVVGSNSISFGDPTIFRYYFNGSYLANINTVLESSGCSFHGTVISSGVTNDGSNFVDVKWNLQTFPYALASVYGTSRNICSNKFQSGWLLGITIQ